MENLSAELKQLQKEYKKATKGTTKSANPDDGDEKYWFESFLTNLLQIEEASTSEGVKAFKKLQLKFKSETKGIVKTIDPKRQDQVYENYFFLLSFSTLDNGVARTIQEKAWSKYYSSFLKFSWFYS